MESSFLNPAKALLAAGIHEGLRVADMDAGAGFFTRAAARLVGKGGEVWAVDPAPEMLARVKNVAAAEGLHNVEVVRGNIEHLGGTNLPDNTFNLVIVANSLFATECHGCVAGEAARILKKGGKALVVDWRDSFGGLGPHASHVVGEAAARATFEEAGFRFVGSVPAGEYHWGVVMQK